MQQNDTLPRAVPVGLALTTCATMLLEISLTRIFSVTMWYHFAFMAISLALFGMAFGAVIVYLRPRWFDGERLYPALTNTAAGFALTICLSFWLHLQIPFLPKMTAMGIFTVIATFLLVAVPFTFSGVAVSLVLTRFPKKVGLLYAWDLGGAAIGCLLLYALVHPLTGPGMVAASAALAALAALSFSWPSGKRHLKSFAALLALIMILATLLQPSTRLFRIKWVKNVYGLPVVEHIKQEPMVEVWNSHSVITVFRSVLNEIFAWGMSRTYQPPEDPPQQLLLTIDAAAGTVITKYSGRAEEIKHLKFDITSLAHHLRPESRALVIGTGGGRDLLTALLFNPKQVLGVEINTDILKLINHDIANFTGHLDQDPRIRFVNDEARSYIERSTEKFDIIQASLIDSWAATSAGAFVLTENSLYTKEAWTEFLNHLTPRGVLTMSRWWVRERPGEMVRVTSLAYAALKELGVENPRNHVLIAATDYEREADSPNGVGTIIVSRSPLTPADIDTFKHICDQMQFRVLLTPEQSTREEFARVLDPKTHDDMVRDFPLNISPPTDNDPFFFNMLRFTDIFKSDVQDQWITSFNTRAVALLGILFGLVLVLTLGLLILPLWLHERNLRKQGVDPLPSGPLARHSLYFAAIGLGFILVEISAIQRLTLFLGHPVYSLVVVLFSILLATGIGASLTGRFIIGRASFSRRAMIALIGIFGITALVALALPSLLSLFHGAPIPPRIGFSLLIMTMLGLPMGAAFPIGLSIANRELPRATPWLWAINGSLSVVGSVLAVILSISYGITATAIIGALCYIGAIVAFKSMRKAT